MSKSQHFEKLTTRLAQRIKSIGTSAAIHHVPAQIIYTPLASRRWIQNGIVGQIANRVVAVGLGKQPVREVHF